MGEFLMARPIYPYHYQQLLALHGCPGGFQDLSKYKRDVARVEEEKQEQEQESAMGAKGDSEDDDVDVDEEEPVDYKTAVEKRFNRHDEETRDHHRPPSPPPVPVPIPQFPYPSVAAAAAAAAVAGEKVEGGLFGMQQLMDRALYEKSIISSMKPNPFLSKAPSNDRLLNLSSLAGGYMRPFKTPSSGRKESPLVTALE